MQTKKVKVIRPFLYDRKRQEVGTVLEVPAMFAVECCAANKAELIKDEPAAQAPEKSPDRSAKGSDRSKDK